MISGCAGISRQAPSRSCSPTSRDRRGCWTSWVRGLRGGTRGASTNRARGSAREGGVEVDTQGDAFFCRASRPHRERSLRPGRSWTDSARDRFAFASASTRERRRDRRRLRRPDVHRAARIAASGHGGQVLVSESATRACSTATRPRDLGEHRFKDLAAAERVYQLGDRRVPAASEPLPDEPPRRRRRRSSDASASSAEVVELLRARRRAARDADGAGRDRQDAGSLSRRRPRLRAVRRRRLVGGVGAAAEARTARHLARAGARRRGAAGPRPRRDRRRACRGGVRWFSSTTPSTSCPRSPARSLVFATPRARRSS